MIVCLIIHGRILGVIKPMDWDSRATLGDKAGTDDLIAKWLEIEAIAKYVKDGMRVLDVGCGNGQTLIELARRYDITGFGIDTSEKMITAAFQNLYGQKKRGGVTFDIRDVLDLNALFEERAHLRGPFDLVYSERCLINLPDWETQKRAIRNIVSVLKPAGIYLMCENSQDGLEYVNRLRQCVGLSDIAPPAHNRYLRETEVEQFAEANRCGLTLDGKARFGSTYAFLSRVVNAYLAQQEGKEPDYDSPINRLALKLPPIGEMGQYTLWRWRKE